MSPTLLERAQQGFAQLDLRDSLKQAAAKNLERWLTQAPFAPYLPYIEHLVQREQWGLLLDSFYKVIPFGTGGRRGPVGVGPNRFNPYTLSTSVQGHVQYLRQRFGAEASLAVVLAYDVRRFADLRGLFQGVEGPLTGLTSKDLAWMAAQVYAANGVKAHILPKDEDSYISTPELSFLIRALGAQGGLNVSASHNPPDDNGGKFYNHLGGQEIPPDDETMAALVELVDEASSMDAAAALAQGLILPLSAASRQGYVDLNVSLLPEPASRSAKIVFTPLHGTGSTTVLPVLRKAGFSVEMEPSQSTFDGAFPAVPYRVPNPEVPASMDRARALAEELGADLVLSTDPDADRLGLLARTAQGQFRAFTGNEIAILLLQALLERRAAQPTTTGQPFVVTTWVTTSMLRRQAEAAGVQVVDSLAVGFKFIAEVLRAIEQDGRYEEKGWDRSLEGTLADFVMGTEESHGFLVTPEVRDKDAAGAALVLAELASLCCDRGETLLDVLDRVQRQHGLVVNHLVSLVMQGAQGLEAIAAIQSSLRDEPPAEIAGVRVRRTVDWHDEERFGPFLSETDRSTRNVLCFFLADGSRVTIRPSGTEPKNKTYVEVCGEPLPADAEAAQIAHERQRLQRQAQAIADDFALQALARVGIEVPRAALRVSDLVPLEERTRVVEQVAPALLDRAAAALRGDLDLAQLATWLDEQLRPCGNDPRGLVAPGIEAAFRDLDEPLSGAKELALKQLA